MDKHLDNIDVELLSKIYGQQFAEGLQSLNAKILKLNSFFKCEGYYPSISSIFAYTPYYPGSDKSFNFFDEDLGTVYIHNSTIANIESFTKIPFGNEYYKLKYHEDLYIKI